MRPRRWRVLTRWVIPRSLEGIGVSIPFLNLPRSWSGRRGAEEGAPFEAPFLRASDVDPRLGKLGERRSERESSAQVDFAARSHGHGDRSELGCVDETVWCAEVRLVQGLNASARNWKLAFSAIRKARDSARSSVCNPGPYTEFRPTLP